MSYLGKKLEEKITSYNAIVGVVGLGYVGSSLAELIARKGYPVIGFERTEKKKKKLEHENKLSIQITTDTSLMRACDIIILCIQTPIYEDKTPNLTFLQEATLQVSKMLQKGQLVTIESSIYPGVTRNVVLPILEQSNLHPEKEFFLAFSPERINPGNDDFALQDIPKVLSGLGDESCMLMHAFYKRVFANVVPVSSLETAEMVKILENTFRFINISLINELKEYTRDAHIDIWEVIHAASTKPFGFLPHYPSTGIGGHCIAVDPFYLYFDGLKRGIDLSFIKTAGIINDQQPIKTATRTLDILDAQEKKALSPLYKERHRKLYSQTSFSRMQLFEETHVLRDVGIKGGMSNGTRTTSIKSPYKILLIGVAYKPNIDDTRESPALKIWEFFEKQGHEVSFHDTYVGSVKGTTSVPLTDEVLEAHDAIVIATNHADVDYVRLTKFGKPIIDTTHSYTTIYPNVFYV